MDSLLSSTVPKSLEIYIMKIYFILIDYLQDDESDIRDAVAEIVSKTILQHNVHNFILLIFLFFIFNYKHFIYYTFVHININ